MTETETYPHERLPDQASPGSREPAGPVLVTFGPAAGQNRLSVAFRIVLAIPHLIVLYILGAVAGIVGFLGWVGALATGRLPGFAAAFLSGYVRWYSRVAAYLLLVTDAYPPFSLEDDAAYPVRVQARPGRLNRVTVLFRGLLAIPAAIVATILVLGASTIVAFVAWLAALVTGRLPEPLRQAFGALLRYVTRYYGYACLLTGTYPAALFGDRPDDGVLPEDWALVLSPAVKRVLALILAVGILTVAGCGRPPAS